MSTTQSPILSYEPKAPEPSSSPGLGLVCGLSAHFWWGFISLYFKWLSDVHPVVVLSWRMAGSALFVLAWIAVRGRWQELREGFQPGKSLAIMGVSGLLIATNWGTFIYAVQTGHLLEASLGYFLTPLLNVLLGVVFLKERLRGWQIVAVMLGLAAVLQMTLQIGRVPWIALVLTSSFSVYGLLRKTVRQGPLIGLMVETTLLALPAVGIIIWAMVYQPPSLPHLGGLSLAGVITALPLIWFAVAARNLRLSTVGFLQYIGPTLQFLIATVVFHEPLAKGRLFGFVIIWIAVLIYTTDSVLHHRRMMINVPE